MKNQAIDRSQMRFMNRTPFSQSIGHENYVAILTSQGKTFRISSDGTAHDSF